MNDDPSGHMSDDELSERIDQLESRAWLKDLRGLQPNVEGQDLFALGFAAGLQAVATPRSAVSRTARTAVVSSLVSLAAAILVMSQLSPSVIRSSGQRVEIVLDGTDPSRPELPALPTQRGLGEVAEFSFEELLPATMRESSTPTMVQRDEYEKSDPKIETESIRYVTQRRGLINEPSLGLSPTSGQVPYLD